MLQYMFYFFKQCESSFPRSSINVCSHFKEHQYQMFSFRKAFAPYFDYMEGLSNVYHQSIHQIPLKNRSTPSIYFQEIENRAVIIICSSHDGLELIIRNTADGVFKLNGQF